MQALERSHVTRHSKTLLITVWHSVHSQLQKNRSFFLSFLAAEGTVFTEMLFLLMSLFPSHPRPAASCRLEQTPKAVITGSHRQHHCGDSNNIAIIPNNSRPSLPLDSSLSFANRDSAMRCHGLRENGPGDLWGLVLLQKFLQIQASLAKQSYSKNKTRCQISLGFQSNRDTDHFTGLGQG